MMTTSGNAMLVAAAATLFAATAAAQDSTVTPGASPSRPITRQQKPLPQVVPFEAGSFLVYPEVVLSGMYDDNVYYSNSGKISDLAAIFSPAIYVQSDWEKHALNFQAGGDFARYNESPTENSDDYRLSVEGRHDLTPDNNIYGGYRLSQDHEDRESPESRNGLTPTRYTNERLYAGMFHQYGRASLRVGATGQRLDFADVAFSNGIINNDDRDRDQYTVGIRAAWEVSQRFEPFVQISSDNRRYLLQPDDLGYYRDSNGERYLIGTRFIQPGKVKAEIFTGYITQRYEDARFPAVSSPAVGANIVARPGVDTTLSFFVDRTVEETTLQGATCYFNTYTAVSLDHRLSSRVAMNLNASFSRNLYQIIERRDDYTTVGGGLYFYVARNLIVETSYRYRTLNSSIPNEDFDKNQVFVRLIVPLMPAAAK